MGCSEQDRPFPARLPAGPRNAITDVAGVTVGHCTLSRGPVQTGVTAVLPHPGSLFLEKVPAGCAVFNGFGKATGLVQVSELGVLETPIILTNTLSVGTAYTALVRRALAEDPAIGVTTGTVNPVVCECNDGDLNDIRGLHVTEAHVFSALDSAGPVVDEGAVGAGRGMVCYGCKGGIGTASRLAEVPGVRFCVGCLVLTNYGRAGDLRLAGRRPFPDAVGRPDKGSAIVLLATDAPLSHRQLNRLSRRAVAGLCRSGSVIGNGSGELALSFSTAYRVPHRAQSPFLDLRLLRDEHLDPLFTAAAEAVEDAVYSSLLHAETVTGVRGHTVLSLRDRLSGAGNEGQEEHIII